MSDQNGTIEIAPGVEITREQAEEALQQLSAVNTDEVTIEIIKVKVRHYKNVEIVDDDGNPIMGEDGKPLTYRKPSTRTANIQNFVPTPLYHDVLSKQSQLKSMDLASQLDMMSENVLKVWQISEPWFTRDMLNEGLDLPVIGVLFKRFFDPSRLQRVKV